MKAIERMGGHNIVVLRGRDKGWKQETVWWCRYGENGDQITGGIVFQLEGKCDCLIPVVDG